ncbi:MAG: T9SS type A sorting domain-containing protein [Bacteroidetes bacterium]|nr:T9SS type A sorting domain-containing protein [Bacteroidota bacterium]
MKNYPLVLFFLLITTFSVNAQGPVWQWVQTDTALNITSGIGLRKEVSAASGTQVLWATMNNVKYSVNPYPYGDVKLTVFSQQGVKQADTFITGKVSIVDIKSDNFGNWYLLGAYYDSLQYGSFSKINTTANGPFYFVARLDVGTLALKWFTPIGVDYNTQAASLFFKDHYLYVPTDSSLSNIIYKIETGTGTTTTVVRQAQAGYVNSVVADDGGNIYVAGSCPGFSTDTFGNQPIAINNLYFTYIVRYRANGTYDWSMFMNDFTCTNRRLNITDNNTIYYTGPIHDTMSMDGNLIPKPTAFFNGNYLAASLDSDGHVRWIRSVKDTVATRVDMENPFTAVATDSQLILVPSIRNYIDCGNGIVANVGTLNVSAVIAYKYDGTPLWIKTTNAALASVQHVNTDGTNIFITGMVRDDSALILDSLKVPLAYLSYNYYLAKLKTGSLCAAPVLHMGTILSSINVYWDTVANAASYEFAVTTSPGTPNFGTLTTANTMLINGNPGEHYYICVRTRCKDGSYSDWSCDTITVPVSVNTIQNKNTAISIFPNPATNRVTISGLDKMNVPATIKIVNVTGSILYQKNIEHPAANEAINTAGFARGMYYIEVSSGPDRSVQKLVLQ